MNLQEHFDKPNLNTPSSNGVKSDSFEYVLIDLHDIITDPERKQKLLPVLDSLIRSQANLHFAEYYGDINILEESIEKKGNTFRGFLVYTRDRLPIAYAIYYPMVDTNGNRAAYCEDAYVTENFRNHGVMQIVFQELARRVLDEGCTYLQWSTDRRNLPFERFVNKIGGHHPEISTLVADDLLKCTTLNDTLLRRSWAQANYTTRPIQPNDVNLMKAMNISPTIIRSTGDMELKGFITFRNGDTKQNMPVCVTPAWEHLSTFRVSSGLYLENPTFAPDTALLEKAKIMCSVIKEIQNYSNQRADKFSYLRWHINNDDKQLTRLLQDKLHLPIDCMIEPNALESEMLVYRLTNGALQGMKNAADENVSQVLHIPRGAPIGPAVRAPN